MPVSTRLLSLGRELDTGPDAFGEPVRSDDAVGQPDVIHVAGFLDSAVRSKSIPWIFCSSVRVLHRSTRHISA